MILKKGDLWSALDHGATLIGVTTNAFVTRDGLVMGRGAALEAVQRWPWVRGRAGQALSTSWGRTAAPYGWLVLDEPRLGLFQVKRHWRDKADLSLIDYSCNQLLAWLDDHPDDVVAINFPGIGNGQLDRQAVLPIIERLPDNVQVWEYK